MEMDKQRYIFNNQQTSHRYRSFHMEEKEYILPVDPPAYCWWEVFRKRFKKCGNNIMKGPKFGVGEPVPDNLTWIRDDDDSAKYTLISPQPIYVMREGTDGKEYYVERPCLPPDGETESTPDESVYVEKRIGSNVFVKNNDVKEEWNYYGPWDVFPENTKVTFEFKTLGELTKYDGVENDEEKDDEEKDDEEKDDEEKNDVLIIRLQDNGTMYAHGFAVPNGYAGIAVNIKKKETPQFYYTEDALSA